MLKVLEAIAVFILGIVLNKQQVNPMILFTNFFANKGRMILLSLIAGITLSTLFAGGIVLCLVGASYWIGDESGNLSFHYLVYSGLGLSVICGSLAAIIFSKKRFHLGATAETPAPFHPAQTQIIEEIVLAVIKNFTSPTAAPPHSNHSSTPPA